MFNPSDSVGLSGLGRRRYFALALLFVLVVSCASLVLNAQTLRERIIAVRAADSDNVGWLVSQLDVDYKTHLLAIKDFLADEPDADEETRSEAFDDVRLTFDLFYSRVETVIHSMGRDKLPASLEVLLQKLSEDRARLTLQLDAIEYPARAAVEDYLAVLEARSDIVRDVTTASLLHGVSQTKAARTVEQSYLNQFWVQNLVLLIITIAASLLVLRLWRELEDRMAMIHRASGTISKVFEASLSAIVVTDLEGQIRLANVAAGRIFGLPQDEMLGRPIDAIMVPEDALERHRNGMRRFRTTGAQKMVGAGPVRVEARRHGGARFPAELSIARDTDLDGNPILIGFIRDISDIVAAEDNLREARDEAQRHANANSMFLATMSHEMRTPLQGVTTSLELIDTEILSDNDRALVRSAQDCCERALTQINDVLEITRLGEAAIDEQAFRPAVIALEIVNELRLLALGNGNTLSLTITGDDAELEYRGAQSTFSRALYNLVGNAIKFTRDGQIDIRLSFRHEDGSIRLRVSVQDNGIGIESEAQERILEAFQFAAPGQVHGPKGTGLGLPIARMAVQRLGGHLFLESALGCGSTFTFDIPLRVAPENMPATLATAPSIAQGLTASSNGRSLEVLVVDDSDVNIELMCETIRRLGHRPTAARNGEDAFEQASDHAFDVLLMDICMPVMDGMEATRHIRRKGKCRGAFIAAVTAVSEPDYQADLLAAGVNVVLVKPVKRTDLAHLLTLASQTGAKAKSIGGPGPSSRPKLGEALRVLEPLFGPTKSRDLIRDALADIPSEMVSDAELSSTSENLSDRLHKAAGAVAVVGLTALSEFLLQAEKAAANGNIAALEACRKEIARIVRNCRKDMAETVPAKTEPATGRRTRSETTAN